MKQRYDSYKPSGIDWIGEIPSHWNVRKTSQIFYGIGSGTTPTSGSKKYYCEVGYNWLQTGDLNDGVITQTSKKITDEALKDYSSLKVYPEGSIVIAMYGATIGKLGKLNINTTTNQACCVLPASSIVDKDFAFYSYWAGKQSLINSAYGGGQPNISQETIKSFKIPLPPVNEQEAIAAWLDEKCGEIDAAIAKVDREIELIDELKQSEISRVVTRGLNPNVKLRPSGIDWIGDIPEHWIKCRLKFIGSARNGLTYSPSDVKDNGKLVIRSSNIQDAKLNYDDCVFVSQYPDTLSIKSGDTIICSRNGSINLIGKSAFIENDMDVTFGAFMMRFRPFEHPKYSHYLLSIAISRYKGLFATTTINQLTAESLGKMEAVMPPYREQQAIADHLDKKCDEIDGLKSKLKRKRDILVELRQAMISEVVTGKRKVV